jgi:ABC-type sugar transport system ATPase subunit
LAGGEEARRKSLNVLDADIDPDVRIQSLSRTEKSLVAIARALAAEAEVLVLDEPTASLPADEVARLFVALRRLRDRGVGIIYVSHRLDEVFEIADRMVVLRDGRVAGERQVDQTTPEEVILLIVGREPSQVFRRPARRMGQPRMASIRHGGGDRTIDCELHAGEVVVSSACAAPARNDRPGPVRHRAHDRRTRSAGRQAGRPRDAAPGDGKRHQSRLRRPGRRVARTQPDDSGESLSEPAGRRLAPTVAA